MRLLLKFSVKKQGESDDEAYFVLDCLPQLLKANNLYGQFHPNAKSLLVSVLSHVSWQE